MQSSKDRKPLDRPQKVNYKTQQNQHKQKTLNKQYTLGIDKQGDYLNKQKLQLLNERRNQQSQGYPNSNSPLDYGSHQYIQTDHSPSPKFKTKTSQSGIEQKTKPYSNPALQKIHQLKPLVDKIIYECKDQSAQVKKGLKYLRQAQMKIVKELQQQDYSKRLKTQSRQNLDEEYEGPSMKKHIVDKMKVLKGLVEKIIRDCKGDNAQVRKSLENIKNIHDIVFDQIQGEQVYQASNSAIQNQDEEVQHIQQIHQPPQNPDFKKHKRQKTNESFPQSHKGFVTDTFQDQIQGLNEIESKVFSQILTLRQEKLQLIKQLNEEINKNSHISRQYKKLQREYLRVKELKNNDQQYESASINNRLDPQRNSSQTLKLKQKIKRLQLQLSKIRQLENEDDSALLKQKLKKQQAIISNLQEDLKNAGKQLKQPSSKINSSREDINKLKNQYNKLQRHLQVSENRIRQLEQATQNYLPLQNQLNQLKRQNDALRAETIRLLKNQNSSTDVEQLKEQIENLREYIQKQNQAKAKFVDQIGMYKKKYEQQNKKLLKRISQLQNSSRNYIGSKSSIRQPDGYENKNKSFTQKYEKQQNYLIKDINQGRIESQSGRLQEYRQLLSGLRNIKGES